MIVGFQITSKDDDHVNKFYDITGLNLKPKMKNANTKDLEWCLESQ